MKEKMICRGDLFYYDFGDNSGSVQSGERPVLVVQADDYNQNAPTIIVAAVTSVIKKRYLPSHIILGEEFGLKKPSMFLLEQIRTVNKEDLLCIEIVEEIGQKLGRQIAGLISIFNPELVIIGGTLSSTGDCIVEPIKTAIRKYSLNLVNKDATVTVSKLKDKAGVVGACMLARSRMFEI